MSDKTSIANRTYAKIGETRISNIANDPSKKALIVNDMWDSVRDALLQTYPWNFAIKRTQIALDGDSPSWGWNNQYLKPVDMLSLLEIRGDPRYSLEGQYIKTDEGAPIYIKYIARIEDVGLWDDLFSEAMAAQLAVESVEVITQSNTKKNILIAERNAIIREAFASDAIQDLPQELRQDSWIDSRESYNDDIDYNA